MESQIPRIGESAASAGRRDRSRWHAPHRAHPVPMQPVAQSAPVATSHSGHAAPTAVVRSSGSEDAAADTGPVAWLSRSCTPVGLDPPPRIDHPGVGIARTDDSRVDSDRGSSPPPKRSAEQSRATTTEPPFGPLRTPFSTRTCFRPDSAFGVRDPGQNDATERRLNLRRDTLRTARSERRPAAQRASPNTRL